MAEMKTLDDLITRQDRYDLNKITFFTMTDDQSLIVQDTTLFQIYRGYVSNYVATYTVPKKYRQYYRFKPRLLSADIYGTPELSWLILMLNDRECPSKFTIKSTIRLVPANRLAELYDTIVTRSNNRLTANWNEYLTQLD